MHSTLSPPRWNSDDVGLSDHETILLVRTKSMERGGPGARILDVLNLGIQPGDGNSGSDRFQLRTSDRGIEQIEQGTINGARQSSVHSRRLSEFGSCQLIESA